MEKFREPKASITFSAREGSALKKIFRMVRFTLFCFFLSLIQVMALDSYSQQTRISLSQHDQRLEDVLKTIEDKSEFFFLYNKDLINVDKGMACIKLLVDNSASRPFSLATTWPILGVKRPGMAEKIRALSRLKYGQNARLVEAEISRRAHISLIKDKTK